jgi:hypothetical protein
MGRYGAKSYFDQLAILYQEAQEELLKLKYPMDIDKREVGRKLMKANVKQLRKAHREELQTVFYDTKQHTRNALKNDLTGGN